MDFKAIMRPVHFGGAAPAFDDVPRPFLRGPAPNRRLAALREAAEVLTVLPARGESLHAIMTGRYDLTDLVDVILEKLGTAAELRIATLSFNGRNVQRMRAWTESRAVERLTLLCSNFFQNHNPDLFQEVLETLAPPHRVAASRNHCKVIAFQFAGNNDKLALEGSANLRTNSNREQFCLIQDARLADWHAAWIDEEVKKHEGDTSDDQKTG